LPPQAQQAVQHQLDHQAQHQLQQADLHQPDNQLPPQAQQAVQLQSDHQAQQAHPLPQQVQALQPADLHQPDNQSLHQAQQAAQLQSDHQAHYQLQQADLHLPDNQSLPQAQQAVQLQSDHQAQQAHQLQHQLFSQFMSAMLKELFFHHLNQFQSTKLPKSQQLATEESGLTDVKSANGKEMYQFLNTQLMKMVAHK